MIENNSGENNLERAARIFERAVELKGDARAAYLEGSCKGDNAMRAEIESMLRAHEAQGDFLSSPSEIGVDDATMGLDAPPMPQAEAVGDVLGHYKLLEKIGEGGFGEVYMAEQSQPVQRKVALKIIKLGMDTKQVIARFEAERQALAIMDHPGIATVLDAGATEKGRPYFVMELVRGEPITDYCDEQNLGVEERLALFQEVCRAVQHAHQKGVIHRDIKPSNVLVAEHDGKPRPKVIDFGIAKATDSRLTEKTLFTEFRQVVGTPEYMSPEQAGSGLDIDTRSDIYSLGVLLYELLTGVQPFDSRSLRKAAFGEIQRIIREETPAKPSTRLSTLDTLPTIAAHRHTEPKRLSLRMRGDLDWIVMKALEKDRTRRYETANSFAQDIERHLKNEPVLASPPSASYRLMKAIKRNKGPVAAAAVIVLVLIAGITGTTVGLVSSIRANRALDVSLREEAAQRALAEANERAAIAAQHEAEESRDETEAVVKFLSDMLAAANPAEQGREVRVREVLDNASRRIGAEFADRPVVEARLRHTMAATYRALGLLEQAEEQIRRAAILRGQEQGARSPATLQSKALLAAVRAGQGHYAEAEALFAETIQLQRQVLGHDHLDTLASLAIRAGVLMDLGKWSDAEAELRAVLEQQRAMLGDDDRRTLQTRCDLAVVIARQTRFDEAEQLYRETLDEQRRVLGNQHPDTLATLHNIGTLLIGEERYTSAESLLIETVRLKSEVLGDEHPGTLLARSDLASAWAGLGHYDRALKEFEAVIALRRKVSGAEHPNTLLAQAGLGLLLRDEGDLEQAVPLLDAAVTAQRQLLGIEHPRSVILLAQAAEAYQRLNRLDIATSLAEEALKSARRILGADHSWTLKAMWTVGGCYRREGRFDEAEPILMELLERRRRLYGEDEPATVHGYGNLAVLYLDWQRLDKAEEYFLLSSSGFRRVFGEEDRRLYEHLRALAVLLRDQRRFDEAELLYAETLEGIRRILGPEHASTQRTLSGLGELHRMKGDTADAERIWLDVYATRLRTLGPFHGDTAGVLVRLSNLYRDLGRETDARTLVAKHLGEEPTTNAGKNELAWMLLTIYPEDLRDPHRSIQLAREVNAATDYKDPHYLDTLAKALFSIGDIATAVVQQRAALERVAVRDRARYQERLDEYEAALRDRQR